MWRLAKSLEGLRDQVNALCPNRSKTSDGTIGDAAHAKTQSDHNPNAQGIVTALDLTHDPKNGLDIQKLFDELAASRDPRIEYLIFNSRIMVPDWKSGWSWVPYAYAKDNPHTKHGHISVWEHNCDVTDKWKIGGQMQAPLVNGKDYNLKAPQDFVDKFYRKELLRPPENLQATQGRYYGELYEKACIELTVRLKDALKQLEAAKKSNLALEKLDKVKAIVNG